MANIIDKTLFVGELDIPTNNVGISNNLDLFITKYEKKMLSAIWGEGELPTDISNQLKPAIACYVYFKWMNDKISYNTGVGTASTKTENSTKVNPGFKMTRSIRECREILDDYYCLVKDNSSYPNWNRKNFLRFYNDEIKGINVFNI